jgi:hypothetical protein
MREEEKAKLDKKDATATNHRDVHPSRREQVQVVPRANSSISLEG